MAFTRRTAQIVHNGGGGVDTVIETAAYNQASGDLIVVTCTWETTSTSPTITDTAGNTYTAGTTQQNNSNAQWIRQFYCINCLGHANNVVTATFGASTNYNSLKVTPYLPAGTAALVDNEVGQFGAFSGVDITGVTAGDLAVFGVAMWSGDAMTALSPWNELDDGGQTGSHLWDRIDSPGGTFDAEATADSGTAEKCGSVMTFSDTVAAPVASLLVPRAIFRSLLVR